MLREAYLSVWPETRPRVTAARLVFATMIVAFAGTLAWLSVLSYKGYNLSAFDLANMSQAIWSATQAEPLIFTSEGFRWSRLALHVEMFYFLLAPVYALLPSPLTLLVIQAVLYAAGAIPLYNLACRRLENEWTAVGVAVVYLIYPVGQTAVLFQFHGDTLAIPLLLFAIEAIDRRAQRSYWLWLALALSCKFYVAVPVAALGGLLWLQGERRVGMVTAVLGVVWGLIAFVFIRPIFAPPEAVEIISGAANYISYYFGQLDQISDSAGFRLANAMIVFMPVLFLGWRAPGWLLVAATTAVPVLLSNGPGPSYAYGYHHYALAVPFLITSVIYGAEKLPREGLSSSRRSGRGYVMMTLLVTILFNAAFVNTPFSPLFYIDLPGLPRGASYYHVSERDRLKDAWLARSVPALQPVMADDLLGSRLVNRPLLYRTQPQFRALPALLPEVEVVVIDALYDYPPVYGQVAREHPSIQLLLQDDAMRLVDTCDGLLFFARQGRALSQQVDLLPVAVAPPLRHVFAELLGLMDAQVEPVGGRDFQVTITWLALRPLDTLAPLLAVSRLDGAPHSRQLHLPVAALRPTTTWPPGQPVRETFTMTICPEVPAGVYPLLTGWYRSDRPFAAQTDYHSRIGDEFQIGLVEVR
jgi:uncharacterized membrane protein